MFSYVLYSNISIEYLSDRIRRSLRHLTLLWLTFSKESLFSMLGTLRNWTLVIRKKICYWICIYAYVYACMDKYVYDKYIYNMYKYMYDIYIYTYITILYIHLYTYIFIDIHIWCIDIHIYMVYMYIYSSYKLYIYIYTHI